VPYIFFVNEKEIKGTLEAVLEKEKINTEHVVDIVYQQQAVFRVRPVTRCTRCVNKAYFYSDNKERLNLGYSFVPFQKHVILK